MKNLRLLLPIFLVLILISSCQDEDDINTDTNPDYYFSISYGGQNYYYDVDLLQSGHGFSHGGFGGYISGPNFGTSCGFTIYFPDTATTSSIMNLVNIPVSLEYSETEPYVDISHNYVGSTYDYSTQYNVQDYTLTLTEITFVENQNDLFDWDVYEVRGTFTAKMEDEDYNDRGDATGEFFMQVTKGNY